MPSVVCLLLYGCLSQVNTGNCCIAGNNDTAAADGEGASSMSSADTQAGLTHPVSGATAVPSPASTNSASSNSTGKSSKGGNSGAAPPMPNPANAASSNSTGKGGKGGSSGAGPPRLPDVATLLDTMRKRLEALNGPALPRI